MTTRTGDDVTWAEYRWWIEDCIANTPRTLQTRIGPSEVGTECTRCLAHKVAGVPETRRDDDWLPTVGHAVHAWLAEQFETFNIEAAAATGDPDHPRFLIEHPVTVGQVGGVNITGNVDLYDGATHRVTDWKVVSITYLRAARGKGPTETYRRQIHLYGKGLAAAGHRVDTVSIAYLPRNEKSLNAAVVWSQPYDEAVAVAALNRAEAIHKAITAIGLERVVANMPPTQGCWSCSRYPLPDGSTPQAPGYQPGTGLQGLIPADTTTAA